MNVPLSVLQIAICLALFWVSGFVQAQQYPECPQMSTPDELKRHEIELASQKFIRVLEKFQNKPAEIVFVLDSSGSVGRANFGCEVQFVRHFSKLFSMSPETSRVAVVTYSSCNKIYNDVDYITSPVGKNKCTLLGSDLPVVNYRDGGTCTVGGLRHAQDILAVSRQSTQKVVFLLTDGQSNDGGSPLEVAASLRNTATIFAIGLGEGISEAELINIASSPAEDHVFLLSLLTDVQRLATLVTGDEGDMASWDRNVNSDLCNSVCTQGHDCCDLLATCSCATQTGSYGCACHPGHKGGGKVGECTACPRGTYKPQYGNQACTACPPLSTTPAVGSTTLGDCECFPGHEGIPKIGVSCIPITCDRLSFSLSSGVMVAPQNCGNHFGIECRLQCREEYRAQPGTADTVRCLATGLWSGEPLQCTQIKCEILPEPSNGHMSCDKTDRSIGTVCNLTCSEGYEREGSLQRRCNVAQQVGEWSSTAGRCKAKTCPALLAEKFMRIRPASCERRPSTYTAECFYECVRGFQLNGVSLRTCQADEMWSSSSVENKCIDIEPPQFTSCPEDISIFTDQHKNFANTTWDQPTAQDNAGIPLVESSPSASQERFYMNEVTVITYTARDDVGLESTCTFSITVEDQEPPRVIRNCPNTIEVESSTRSTVVHWEEPVFKDNSEQEVKVKFNRPPGSTFYWGLPERVQYEATDQAGNTEICEFSVSVKQYRCPFHSPPQNGALACETWLGGQFCRVLCNEKFDFNRDPEDLYYCRTPPGSDKADWGPSPFSTNPAGFRIPWPKCTVKRDPSVEIGLELQFFAGDCQLDENATAEIKEDFFEMFQEFGRRISGFCQEDLGCRVENVEVSCAQDGQLSGRRRRQANNVLSIKFTVNVDAAVFQMQNRSSVTDNSVNSIGVVDTFMEVMDTAISTGQLNLTIGEGEVLLPTGPVNILRPIALSCQEGEVLRNYSCVICPAGTYHDVEGGICQDCSIGFYQDMEGQLACQRCPEGTTTHRTNTIYPEDCKVPCPRGTFSSTRLKSCTACPRGTYQPITGSSLCLKCPDGLTTWTEGTVSVNECSGECPIGTYSGTGFTPCSPCPKGTYQPDITQTSCTPCPDGLFTHKEGAHALGYCQVINECDSQPCHHGSLCVDVPKGYKCICEVGFTGPDCRINIDDCNHDLCLNNGTCVDLVAMYLCDCPAGFQGEHCQIDIDECESNPCHNRAVCVDGQNSYYCECARGFTGDFCEINFFDCASDPCQNEGTCVDLPQNFTCCCRPGYRGRYCEMPVDHCQSSPCMNNATCRAGFNSVSCVCLPGYTGKRCEVEINECELEPVVCQHGGTCEDIMNGFKCNCYPGYSGTYCETALLGDFDLSFPVAGTSDHVIMQNGMPGLHALTVTFWMRTTDKANAGTPLSYATRNADGSVQDNAFTISDYNSIVIIVNGDFMYTDVKLNSDPNWHHVGITWASTDGHWAIYMDGSVRRSGTGFMTGSFIRGSGALVLGQEQDSFAGSFTQTQAFVGDLSQLNLWDYAMTQDEIIVTYSSCAVSGNVMSWSQVASNINGEVRVVRSSQLCQAITNCQPSTCNNNGVCTDLISSFKCDCALGFHGTHCELVSTSCTPETCLNEGNCRSNGSSLFCECTMGYSGERCGIRTNPCHSVVCLHGATCTNEDSLPKCNCLSGFTGRICEYDVNECDIENGGCSQECHNTLGSYYCSCSNGFALQQDQHTCNDISYCTHEGRFHLLNDEWDFNCSACHCEQGTAVCEVKKCAEVKCKEDEYTYEAPGACCPVCLAESRTCSVSLRGKHKTYDGMTYDTTGNCRYVLSQDCVGSQFTVEVQYEANKKKIKRRALWLRLDCVEIEVAYDGSVKVTGIPVELPYIHAEPMNVMITPTNSSIDDGGVLIKTNRGVVVRWSKRGKIEVSAPGIYSGKLCGLCGNMNGIRKDDRTTRQFLPSRSIREFAHSWKVDGYRFCSVPKIRAMTRQAFGAISTDKIPACAGLSYFLLKDVRNKCSALRQRSFQMCHSVVNPTRYFEWCMQDACTCHSNEPCHCEAITAYIYECKRNNVPITWAQDSACNIRCPEGMIYDHCGPTCLSTCLNPYPEGAECHSRSCVPQCQCPAGTVLNGDACILPAYCPAITKED